MKDVLVGVAAMGIGGLLCFKGNLSVRALMGLWGGFAGFLLGGALINASPGDTFLQSSASWLVGVLGGFVLGTLAYMFYEVAMVMLLAATGFLLATAAVIVFNLDWSWLTVLIFVLVGVAGGLSSFVYALPKAVVVGAAALSGASVFTMGMMLLFGVTKLNEVGTGTDVQRFRDAWAWLVALGVIGAYSAYLQWQASEPSLADRKHWPLSTARR